MTIKTKIIFWCTLVCGLMLSAFAGVIYHSTREAEITKLDSRLSSHGVKARSELEEDDNHPFDDKRVRDIRGLQTPGLYDVRIQLIDTGGGMAAPDSVLSVVSSADWRRALGNVPVWQTIHIGGSRYRALYIPIERHDRVACVLQVAASMADVYERLSRLRIVFMLGIPAALFIMALAVFFITRRALKPVSRMIMAARRISGDNLRERIPLPAVTDEVHLLAGTLNGMLERINAAFVGQRQFIADASHEIRTPLTIVRGELEFAMRADLPPPVRESLQISLGETERLSRMAESLLLLARMDAAQLVLGRSVVRLDELVMECVQNIRSIAEKKEIPIGVEIDDPVEIAVDAGRVKSVIVNLLDNAVKYSPPGNPIAVRLSVDRNDPAAAVLSVRDRGAGIDATDLPHVFERFYRGASPRSKAAGSGLGLSIVKAIVELHGGTVFLDSAIGKGTTVTVRLPLCQPS